MAARLKNRPVFFEFQEIPRNGAQVCEVSDIMGIAARKVLSPATHPPPHLFPDS